MKTRDPDHPGAQGLSPIKPGTLCLVVNGTRLVWPDVLGRTVTALRELPHPCTCCGERLYLVAAPWLRETQAAARSNLQPILPPGIDDQVEQSVGNPQLEVV